MGEQGPPGAQGEAGPSGEQGPQGEPGADAAVSGSRIKARWVVSDDGARHFLQWYDSLLGFPCVFARSSDGIVRCVPNRMGMLAGWYADAACTQPTIQAAPYHECAPTYVTLSESALDCDDKSLLAPMFPAQYIRQAKVVKVTSGPVPALYVNSAAQGCQPTAVIDPHYLFEVVPITDFAPAAIVTDP